ncbi:MULTISPECIES: hypothetical protein [Acetobacter]|jgi:Holliday junction resolvase|uniref:hypothetical protein n=1 Tax=Acetobacter TaxID=434 RepID=UPI0015C96B13|nr:hypothetical protein [Acetobacter fabarum]
MAKRRFKAKIYLRSGSIEEIFVEAENQFRAKELIDMQYGNPRYFIQPVEVR